MTEGLESIDQIDMVNFNWIGRAVLNVCKEQVAAHNLQRLVGWSASVSVNRSANQ
jgi:hypothetical protein